MNPSPQAGTNRGATAAEVLAIASQISLKGGDFNLARAQLHESLSLLLAGDRSGGGIHALDAAAALAEHVGDLERAVEFLGAADQSARQHPARETARSAEARTAAEGRLRGLLDEARFAAAWDRSWSAPYPYEQYVVSSFRWLESVERYRHQPETPPSSGLPSDPPGSMQDLKTEALAEAGGATTARLIDRAVEGSSTAKERLSERMLDPLRTFAHGRLPPHARDLMDTDDLVQETIVRGMGRLDQIRTKEKGGFLAYLRTILLNRVRDEIRRTSRRPRPAALDDRIPSRGPSPLQEVLDKATLASYAAALSRLEPRSRRAVLLRVEHGLSYGEIANEVDCPTPNAARMLVSRSLAQVALKMKGR